MMSLKIFLSICIPSYNRPESLIRLLESIDYFEDDLEVVICEDKSPKREEIKTVVEQFKVNSSLNVKYYQNTKNLGYDANLRELIDKANGEYIIYMGDDDYFVKDAINDLIAFLKENDDLGYILRAYQARSARGVEEFRYYDKTIFFEPGFDAMITLYRKSVFISGFTFKRELAISLTTSVFDGTLLYQLYLVAEIALQNKTAYFNRILTEQEEGGIQFFGSALSEKELYTPGEITMNNSINFMKGFFQITKYLDKKYNIKSTDLIQKDFSKYSYPVLSIQKNNKNTDFKKYVQELTNIGLAKTIHFKLYVIGLNLFGKNFCDKLIILIKKIVGRTPVL